MKREKWFHRSNSQSVDDDVDDEDDNFEEEEEEEEKILMCKRRGEVENGGFTEGEAAEGFLGAEGDG